MTSKKLIVFILSLMGISVVSCMKYGEPYAEFELKGKVTDTLDNPIENIRVTIQPSEYSGVYSDTAGNFRLTEYMPSYANVTVKIEDTDGEENGGDFFTQIISFPLKQEDFVTDKKKDKWYEGKASKEINFKLEKK